MKDLLQLKFYTRSILVALSSLIILIAVIIPQILAYFNVAGQVGEVESRASSIEAKAAELQNIDEQLYKDRLETVFTALPQDKEIPLAMVTLQDIISRSGLILDTVKLIDTPAKSSSNSYLLSMFVAGQKESLKTFLLGLLDAPRIFKLEAISAQSVRGGIGLEAEIQVSVYYDPSSSVTSNLDQPLPKLTAEEERFLADIMAQVNSNRLPISVDNISIPSGKADPFN